MKSDSERLCYLRELFNWIIISITIFRTWSNQANCIRVYFISDSIDVSSKILGNWNFSDFDTHVEAPFIKSTVSCFWKNNIWLNYSSLFFSLYSVCKHWKNDTFGSTTSNNAACIFVSFVKIKSPSYDFCLHLCHINKFFDM